MASSPKQTKTPHRVALLTGCSVPTSLGATLTRQLNDKGWVVFASARDVSTLTGLSEAGCEVLQLDVTCSESVQNALQHISSRVDRLDLLINNAVWGIFSPLLNADLSDLQMLLDINYLGPHRLVQAFAPLLVQSANLPNGHGQSAIVNIGSNSKWGLPSQGAYGASKAALMTWSDTLRMELKPLGVDVITVHQGVMKTTAHARADRSPLSRDTKQDFYPGWPETWDNILRTGAIDMAKSAPTPDIVARQIITAVEKKTRPGAIWTGVMAGMMRWFWPWFPVWLTDWLFSKVTEVKKFVRPVA